MPEKIGVFLPNWIGDVVMATPALRALERRFGGQAEIVGILRPYVADVLSGTPWLNRQILYDRKKGVWSLVRRLREERLSRVVLLTNSLVTAAISWLGGAKERIGFARECRGPLLTKAVPFPRDGWKYARVPPVDAYLQLAYAAGCGPEEKRLELATLPEDEAAADSAWERLQLPHGSRVVILNGGGGWGGTATAKAWPGEHFAELARRIVAESDWHVLVSCGPNEREISAEIARRANHPRVRSLAELPPAELNLGLIKAIIRRSALIVTTDSGPRHIGTAFGRPVIGLFGPFLPEWTETYHPRGITLINKVPCSPCEQKFCPLKHHDCMRGLSVERVYAAVMKQLAIRDDGAANAVVRSAA